MTEKQPTSVEWLVNQMKQRENQGLTLSMYELEMFGEQAKEMEKKQREHAFVEGYKTRALASNLIFDEASELYAQHLFNKTFKSE